MAGKKRDIIQPNKSGSANEKVLDWTESINEAKPVDETLHSNIQSHASKKGETEENEYPSYPNLILLSPHVLMDNRERRLDIPDHGNKYECENKETMKAMLSALGISQNVQKPFVPKQTEVGHEGSSDEEMAPRLSSNCASKLGRENQQKNLIRRLKKKVRFICKRNTQLKAHNIKLKAQLASILLENCLLGSDPIKILFYVHYFL